MSAARGFLGMRFKRHDPQAFKLRNLLDVTAAKVPTTHTRKLGRPWGMLGNDRYGDCAFAGLAHAAMLWAHVERRIVSPSTDDVVNAYLAYTGGADTGTDVDEMLAIARRTPIFAGTPSIHAYASIDPANARVDLPRVDYLFGTAFLGLALPRGAQGAEGEWPAPPTGWQSAPEWAPYSWGGHLVVTNGYTTRGVKIVTWGRADWFVPWAFLDAYLVGAWGVITPAWLNANKRSPQGLDVAKLDAELGRLAA